MSLLNRLRALFSLREQDIGLLRTRGEVRAAAKQLPRVRIGDAVEGARGVFIGRVVPRAGLIVAPLSLRECVAFRVGRWSDDSRRVGGAVFSIDETSSFAIDDGTGVANVSTSLLSLHVGETFAKALPTMHDRAQDLRDAMRRALQTDWIDRALETAGTRVEYREARLVAGDPVVVIGSLSKELNPNPTSSSGGGGYRSAAMLSVIQPAPDAIFLYVADADEHQL